jgi:hypothetical protein
MPSIFIWKADVPNTSKKTIRFYSGSNWALEDNDYSSKSYMYIDQIVISESDNSVITFHSKEMPQDWVGTELLEVTNIPYEVVKTDGYGTLEMIGNWMRFTSRNEINFEEETLKNEFINIKKWINQKSKQHSEKPKNYQQNRPQKQYNNDKIIDHQKVQLNFQEFLIKYTQPLPQPSTYLISSDQIKTNFTPNNYKKMKPNVNKVKSNKFNA